MGEPQRFDFDSVDSTNEVAKRLVAEGRIRERAVIVAREQTAGKGTRGRTWISPKDAGIYLSLAEVCAAEPRTLVTDYTLAAAVGCVEALADVAGVTVNLKPINDLFAKGCKLGGILIETAVQHGAITSLITGMGINYRRAHRTLPPDAPPAICLEDILSAEAFDRLDLQRLVAELIERIGSWNAVVAEGRLMEVRAAWERHKLPGTALPVIEPQRLRDTEE